MSRQGVMNGTKGLQEKGIIEVQKMVSADGDRDVNVYSLRFRERVANEVDHPSQRGLLRVGNKVDPQQTVKQQTDVVVIINALKKLKIEEEKAGELAARHSPEYIEEKIEFLEWKIETKTRGRPISDPAAWLIRAIEKDYQPPDSFKPKAQRQDEAKEIARQEAEIEKQRRTAEVREAEEKANYLEELRGTYGTTQEEVGLWAQVLQEIELATTKATYRTWFPHTTLLSLQDGEAVIGVPNQHTREWLSGRLASVVQRALESVSGKEMAVEFLVLNAENPAQ